MDIPSDINAVEQPNKNKLVKIDLKTFKGEIEFKNVWFRYPTRRNDWILKGLNMKIHGNERIALVGESGCGKSTVVCLLLRFYDVNEGRILIDGIDIREYDLQELRRAMGLVMQEPTLFNYSISENILYGNMNSTNQEIFEAANVSNALEFIDSQSIQTAFDDSAEALLNEFIRNERCLRKIKGDNEFEDTVVQLEKSKIIELQKGHFTSSSEDIDKRSAEQKKF